MFPLYLVSHWRLFKKMGSTGWTCLIPLYSWYCVIEALYGNGWYIFVPPAIGSGGALLVSFISFAFKNFKDKLTCYIVGYVVLFFISIYVLIRFVLNFVHSFGKKGWWTIGALFFFPIIVIVFGISDFEFKNRRYPYYDDYDAIDGFIEFFRNQNPTIVRENTARRCKECGTLLRDNAIFCSKCGARNDL